MVAQSIYKDVNKDKNIKVLTKLNESNVEKERTTIKNKKKESCCN